MSEKECKHYWIPSNTDDKGNAEFNRYMGKFVTHATCSECNTRTWFTPEQWADIPAKVTPK